ncbi:imidazolonepropionase-like amidohydrolase [Haloactinopolyspora alba]|uniref:Imidazolonepropionase-like amidohydrolase n=1 Tax=Haloactinopolyspora alba TaxID=648780 RepID=A0A2P8EF87_9ACTN|nr:amidohydrolase family protein [Haloactinopolyspora alba]PSL08111.1 imidazolonepropionase-like amidohydrolase [Haloactinopolyspora alba]
MPTTLVNARIFDGSAVRRERSLTMDDGVITAIGAEAAALDTVVDAGGGTVLPGLIDSHVHTTVAELGTALRFGVTTALEMQGFWTAEERAAVAADPRVADLRVALTGLMAKDGHPSQLIKAHNNLAGDGWSMPSASTPDEAAALVAAQVADGADYIKVMIEEGTVLGHPGLPVMTTDTLRAGVDQAHHLNKKVIAHAMTVRATEQALEIGVDGLAHLFVDQAATSRVVSSLVDAGVFVTPCLVMNSSTVGYDASALAADSRVRSRLNHEWLDALGSSFNSYPEGRLADVFESVAALHEAGVPILAGTDASPLKHGGIVHGASVHHELQLLVEAGLSPTDALRSATQIPAERFGLADRGRIEAGKRADILLVGGDPTAHVSDTLDLRGIWRAGMRLECS